MPLSALGDCQEMRASYGRPAWQPEGGRAADQDPGTQRMLKLVSL